MRDYDSKYSKPWFKGLLLTLGFICVALGVIGLFVPMMPGAVFLFLAAWLFSRSSERFHTWLLDHKHLGPVVQAWASGQGLNRALRRRILLIMWASMLVTMLLIAKLWAVVLVAVCGILVTIYLLKQPLHSPP